MEDLLAAGCSIWKSNLAIIKNTYTGMGTGGKFYTTRLNLKQDISNLDLKLDDNLNKMRNILLNLIDNAPTNTDPTYNMEFTQESQAIRNQIKLEIQKHVDSCK